MIAIGTGPGPKNVLVELDDGTKTVVPYAIWKHKLSKERTQLAEYKAFAGFIQFDPNERETPGKQTLRDVVIQPIGYSKDIPSLRVTIWPEFGAVALERGDFIAVQGKFTTANVKGKTYYNLSASQLVRLAGAEKASDEVENPVEEEDEDFDPGF